MSPHLMSLSLLIAPFAGVGIGLLAHTLWSLWIASHD